MLHSIVMLGMSKLRVRDLNEHVTCSICNGYFIDATTIIECLHSFCRSCIVTHMMINRCCPKCEVPAHKTRPLLSIRSDKTLQDIVYKLVPELLEKENSRKKQFHEETGIPMDTEEQKRDSVTLTPEKRDHCVSLSLEYDEREVTLSKDSEWAKEAIHFPKRYLRCYDSACISTINKLVRNKLCRDDLQVLSFCRGEVLPETYTLSDITSTLSCKLDRPLPLTYMTFSGKTLKRKHSEEPEQTVPVAEQVPPKKAAIETEPCNQTPTHAVAPMINTATVSSPEVAVTLSITKDTTNSTVTPTKPIIGVMSDKTNIETPTKSEVSLESNTVLHTTTVSQQTNTLTPTMPSTQALPWKPAAPTQQSAKPVQQVTGVKAMSYSVRNVPFANAMNGTAPEKSETSNPVKIQQPFVTTNANTAVSASPSQSFTPCSNPSTHTKVKSINSIANRLQMEKVKSAPQTAQSPAPVNIPDSIKVKNTMTSHAIGKQVTNIGTPRVPSDVSPNMKRNQMAQRINASTFRGQNFNDDSVRNLLRRQEYRLGSSGSQGYPARNETRTTQNLPTPGQATYAPFDRPAVTNPPDYTQATDQRNRMLQQRHQQIIRPKFHEMKQMATNRERHTPPQQQYTRVQNVSNSEDSQLLSTTRQLASLREQQKMLNEIAAAMAARPSNMRTPESVKAVMSSLSPKSSSSLVASTSSANTRQSQVAVQRAAHNMRRPPHSMKMSPAADSYGNRMRAAKPNGSKSFTESPRMPVNDMGHPSLNKRRDGGIDIYQNTIARAKAQIREMNKKDKAVNHQRNQLRASVSPYNVQNRNLARKPTPNTTRLPSYPHNLQQRPPAQNYPLNPMHRSGSSHYRGVNTRPPPPPPPQQRYMPPNVFKNTSAPARYHRPTHVPYSKPPPFVTPPVSAIPEQDQPLCLVMKK